jgi:hypothetical protein
MSKNLSGLITRLKRLWAAYWINSCSPTCICLQGAGMTRTADGCGSVVTVFVFTYLWRSVSFDCEVSLVESILTNISYLGRGRWQKGVGFFYRYVTRKVEYSAFGMAIPASIKMQVVTLGVHESWARPSRGLNFVPWRLIFVRPRCRTWFVSPCWIAEFWCGS